MTSQRLLELLLGLDRGFLSRDGNLSLAFRPRWPFQEYVGVGVWNLLLLAAGVAVVWWAYRRDGRSAAWRAGLGTLRLGVLVVLLVLLNRPTLALERIRVEPSVVAVLIDASASMTVADVETDSGRIPRIDAAGAVAAAARAASRVAHDVRLFSADTTAVATDAMPRAVGAATSLARAVDDALRQLRGQNVAGVVLVSDGRDTDADPAAEAALRRAGVPVIAVGVGDTREPANVTVEGVSAEPVVFAGDTVNVVARVRARGLPGDAGPVTVRLLRDDGSPALDADLRPVTATLTPDAEGEVAAEVELQLPTTVPEQLALVVEAEAPAGVTETDLDDNRRTARVDVLESDVRVLYVDGYPRWEYRYLRNLLLRDATIDSSILLLSADAGFAQEGDSPIRRFPVSADELGTYDVVLFGDVSPRQFSDGQLELLREFVGDRGGGFGLVAGPRYGPWAWRGTAVEALLPVDVVSEPSRGDAGVPFRPGVTDSGRRTGIFRFFADLDANEAFLADGIRELYWFATGVRPKAGIGDVLAEHPDALTTDGRPAPLLVAGRFGAGRTLFNGIDESWRWRFYTAEAVFDTFWAQQIRFLARGRKLGERRAALAILRPTYDLGERASAELRVLDPRLAATLPDRIDADLRDADGNAVAAVPLERRRDAAGGVDGSDRYTGTFPLPRPGLFTLVVPPLASDAEPLAAEVFVGLPQTELRRPATDFANLARLADATGGRFVTFADASDAGAFDLPPAERRVPVVVDRPLWDAPLAFGLLALLLTLEWTGRKLGGLI